jgi:predicted amidohydrolase YtcJ
MPGGAAAMVAAALTAACGGPAREPADLVLRGGKIVTVDEARPEAQAVAIKGERIVAVGSDEEIRPYVGPATEVVDLEGRLAIPGFIEGHGHFTGIGQAKLTLDLREANSWEEIVAMVAEAVTKARPGDWILGRGWHQEKWDRPPTPNVAGFPVHDQLSKVSPDNPVLLTHASGHASFVNAKAMELAGIGRTTPNPPGGEILRDRRGNPTGLLNETAQELVRKARADFLARRTPEEVEKDARREIDLALQEVLSKGITTFQDAGSSFGTVDLLKKYADEGRLAVRMWVMLREGNEALRQRLAAYRLIGYGNGYLTVRAIKRSIDGALGSRGAWLLEPYSDLPGSTGMNTTPVAEIEQTARLAIEQGFQLCVHAIGDRANRETLDLFERVFKANPDKKDLRWRIEHAQHLHPADIPRFARLGVIASMQGSHATSDAPFVIARLGEQRAKEGAYVWRSLLASGAIVINGSDAPVEPVDPLVSFYASVTRRLKDGREFFPEQRMTREEALRSYTINAAYAGFEEKDKGSIAPGKLADITVLSRDILTVPEDQILGTEVVYTIVGGKVRYRRDVETTRRE